jgi:hypothetical protein
MRWVLLLFALLGCSSAQERPDAPHRVPEHVEAPEAVSKGYL